MEYTGPKCRCGTHNTPGTENEFEHQRQQIELDKNEFIKFAAKELKNHYDYMGLQEILKMVKGD